MAEITDEQKRTALDANDSDSVIEKMMCPNCGQCRRFRIRAVIWTDAEYEGCDSTGSDTEWDGSSLCQCPRCKYTSSVNEFTISDEEIARLFKEE